MIVFDDVSFAYENNENREIKNVNLDIKKGEFVLLTGKSGCGKSTMLNMISGIIPHHINGEVTGKLTVAGCNVNEKTVQELSYRVGSVFQNPKSQFFHLNTTDEILFSASNKGVEKEELVNRLEKTTDIFELEKLLDRNIFNMSGGEKQKIACASVYAGFPKVFILDEPSANLDNKNIIVLKGILEQLKAKGYTIVVAEHRLYYLMDLCDRIVYINNGKIENNYTINEFREIGDCKRKELGLRSILPTKIKPTDRKMKKSGGLEIKNLNFAYDNKTKIFNNANLNFQSGVVTAVIGENGCGKSTFAHIVCGLIKSKDIYLNGKQMNNRQRQKKVNIVMQDVNHQLFTESVLEEIVLDMHQKDKDKIDKLLKELELWTYKEHHPLSLSGGQKQRLTIASCISSGRKIMILDEPTSGLDYNHMLKVSNLLNRLKQRNMVIVVITHDNEFINACCDKIVKFDNNK